MKKTIILIVFLVSALLFAVPGQGFDGFQDWDSSPQNWKNSPNNWDNSPHNWKNSPHNWENSPQRWGNERIIRDNSGRPQGYIVPKEDGGANIFNFKGERKVYIPGNR